MLHNGIMEAAASKIAMALGLQLYGEFFYGVENVETEDAIAFTELCKELRVVPPEWKPRLPLSSGDS